MSIASSLALIQACCKAGIMGCFPTHNAAQTGGLDFWIAKLMEDQNRAREAGQTLAPFAVNINVSRHKPASDLAHEIALCRQGKLPIITSNAGDPSELIKAVHDWGGIVIHDATTLYQAEKAIEAGVDGLMLVCAGAGGLGGSLTPFSFVPAVRSMFDGIIQLAGGVSTGAGIAAAELLGADMVCMGTRFIATRESGAPAEHKQMLTEAGLADIVWTDRICGIHGSFLAPSIRDHGLDPADLPPLAGRRAQLPKGVKAWRDIWSGGQSAAMIDAVPCVAELIDDLETEYHKARQTMRLTP